MKRLMIATIAAVMFASAASAAYVAQVGKKKYTTLETAFANVTDEDDTITVLNDCEAGTITLPTTVSSVVLDLGGKTVSVVGTATAHFLGDEEAYAAWALTVRNGTISMSCGGLLELSGKTTNRVTLEDLTVTSSADPGSSGKFMVYVCGNLTVTRCRFLGKTTGAIGTNYGAGNYTDSLFSIERLPTGIDPTTYGNKAYKSSCIFAGHGAVINVRNCVCCGKTASDPAPYVGYEGNSDNGSVINYYSGAFNGPMMSDFHSDTTGNYIYGGTFSNCTFMTRSNQSGYTYYHISGGAFDENPMTNGCRYIDAGFYPDYDADPDLPGMWTVEQLVWSVSGTNVVYDGEGYRVSPLLVSPATANLTYSLAKDGTYRAEPYVFTNVCDQTVYVKLETKGFDADVKSAKVVIAKRPVTLTSGSQTWTYDGLYHSNMTVTVSGAGFVKGESVLTNTFKRVKAYGIVASNTFAYAEGPFTSTNNYDITVRTGELRILPADTVEIWIAAKAITNDYTGVAQTNVGFEIVKSTVEGFSHKDFTFTGCSNLVETTAGTYAMNLKQEDFSLPTGSSFNSLTVHVVQDGELVINKVEAKRAGGQPIDAYTRDPSDPTKPYSQFDIVTVYDGKGTNVDFRAIKAITLDPPTSPMTYQFGPSKDGPWKQGTTKYYDVVSTSVWYRIASPNTFDYVHEVKLVITNRPATLTSATQAFDYDGNWHSNVTVIAENFVEGEGVVTNGFSEIRDFGSVPNAFDYAAAEGTKLSNYTITCVTGELSVVAGPVSVTITAQAITNAYTGAEQRNDGFAFAADNPAFGWDCFTFTGCSNLVATKAGTYAMNLAPSQFALTSDRFSAATFTIAQDGLLVITNVPPVTPWGPVDPIDPPADGDLSKPFSTNDVTVCYDGAYHTIDTNALASLAYVPASELTVSYALTKDGDWQAEPFLFKDVVATSFWYKVESTGADDFVHAAKLVITNRPATLTSGSQEWTWDGLAHSNLTVVAEGFVDGEGVVTNGFATIVDVGVVPNAFSYAAAEGTDLANYTITCVTGELSVVEAPGGVTSWAELKAALSVSGGTNVTLGCDIAQDSAAITLGADGDYVLDLNGHTVTGLAGNRLFEVDGAATRFTVTDGATGGALQGAATAFSGNGGCLLVTSGTAVLDGGTLVGFSCTGAGKGGGGAVHVDVDGAFVLNGGAIRDCRVTDSSGRGGAIYAAGPVTVNGGTITGCESPDNGGAIYVVDAAMKMTGGVIRDCAATGADAKGGAIEVKGTSSRSAASVTVTGGAFLGNTHMGGTANDFDVSSQGGNVYLYGLVSDVSPNATFVVNDAQVAYETVTVGDNFVVASEGSATVSGNLLTAGTFTFDVSRYADVAPVIDASSATLEASGTDAVGNPLWTIVRKMVTVIPADLANATAEVYEGDVLVSGPPYRVGTNSEVRIVYTATRGYMFDDGTLTKEYAATASKDPLADTTAYVIGEKQAAKIGETVYPYLTDAFAAAQDGDTIVMVGDDMVEETITVGAFAVTLDLAGRTVTGETRLFLVGDAATDFTITDSLTGGALKGDGSVVSGIGGCLQITAGAVTLNGGTIRDWTTAGAKGSRDNKYGGGAVAVAEDGTFVMNGGVIENCRVDAANDNGRGGAIYAAGAVRMSGGTVAGCSCPDNGGAFYVDVTGEMEISGGVVSNCTAGAKGAVVDVKTGTVKVTGGAFLNNSCQAGSYDFDVSDAGGDLYLYGLVSTAAQNADFVVTNELVQYETVAVGDNFVVAATGTVTVTEGLMTAGTFTFDPTRYAAVLPVVDPVAYKATADGEDAEGNPLWTIEDNIVLYEVKPATADGLTVKVYTNGVEVAGPRYLVLPDSLVTNIYATTGTYYFTNGTRTATTELTVATDPTQDTVMDVWNSGWHCVDDYEGDDTAKIYQAAIADGFSENIATRLSRSGVKGYEHFCKWANVGVKGQQYSTENLKNATNLLFKAAYLQPWDRSLDDWGKWSPWLSEVLIYPSWPKPNPTYFYPTNYVDEAYGATGKELSIYSYWMLYGEATAVDGELKSNELFWNSIGCKSALNGSGVLTETSGVARVTFVNVTNNAFKAIFIPKWDPEKEEPPKSFIASPIFY